MTSASDPLGLVGTTIADKYAVESIVGQGGFATVFRAQHILWKRPVAVKVFTALGEVAENQRQKLLDDFIQEGALLADLSESSTAIVQARDIGMLVTSKGESVPYMVLEWLDGKTLEEVLAKERENGSPLRSLEDTVRLLNPIAEALALANRKGIAHRDVKPANVFVLAQGVKLLDFGIAKVAQDVEKMGFGKTAGHITSFTPLYGAPEQFNRAYGATGPWTDVFALSLVLCEILSGKEPMSGDTLVQLAVASGDITTRPTPRTLGVTISDEIEAILRKAVAVKPDERWQNVGDFWNALRTKVLGDKLASLGTGRFVPAKDPTKDATPKESKPPSPNAETRLAPLPAAAASPAVAVTNNPATTTSPAVSPATPAETEKAPAKSPVGLIVGIALGVVVLGGGAYALRGQTAPADPHAASPAATSAAPSMHASAGTGTSPSAKASASATPPMDCPKGMIFIPGGDYFMGSEEKDALEIEKPPHRVKLSPYCMDELEATVAQYKECSDKGVCRRAGKENVWPGIKEAQKKIYDPLCNINDPTNKAQHPINCVDWDQAREACEARGARLPTEAEWEFAARGSDGRVYPWGDEAPSHTFLNACGKECVAWQKMHRDPETLPALMYDEDDGFPHTAPVGSFPKGKSRYGIQDVVGNVWEWVADYYAEYDKAAPATTDPKGPPSGEDRVIRGGAWNGSTPSWVRPSFRFHAAPTQRNYAFGFRCAKSR